jgi:diguanylate cyclase (GGDEF)-like protein
LKGNSHIHIPYLCVPLIAQGETIGLLHLQCRREIPPEHQDPSTPDIDQTCEIVKQLALNFNERIAMALSNLRLRDTLRQQSIRDPLTDLYNRRYMEATLERELYRSQRFQSPLGIIMLDIDFFKRFNEEFGHEAGDLMLQELGQFLQNHIRKDDVACRYGGEEFTLILPGASRDIANKRAEILLKEVKNLRVKYAGEILGPIALSLGVSIFPDHGETAAALLKAADRALLQAKKEGRDRIVISDQSKANSAE